MWGGARSSETSKRVQELPYVSMNLGQSVKPLTKICAILLHFSIGKGSRLLPG